LKRRSLGRKPSRRGSLPIAKLLSRIRVKVESQAAKILEKEITRQKTFAAGVITHSEVA
jgi:hypothetical protein